MFSNLSNRERGDEWKYVSNGAAPHQPLLLLAVIGLYDQNPQRSNMVVLDDELERTFNSSFSIVVPSPHPTTIVMPFIALHNEPFWHLEKRRGAAEIVGANQERELISTKFTPVLVLTKISTSYCSCHTCALHCEKQS